MSHPRLRILIITALLLSLVWPMVHSTSAAPQQPAAVTRFAAVGDYGDASANEQAVATLINSLNPDFVVTTGDNSYGSTAPVAPALSTIDHNIGRYFSGYIGAYTGGFGSGSVTNRFFPSIGNHDYTDGGGITAYLNYFALPGAGITTTNTSGNERYYDFVQGPVHFFAINSDTNEPNGTSSSSTQAQWLQTQLAASTAPWKIVYFHHPPFTSGTTHANATWMQWPFQAWGATAVLNGHNHHYERIMKNGFPYFVTGAGGHSLYSFNATPEPGSAVRYNTDYGTMLIEATPITMTFKFYSIAGGAGGTLIDSYTINAAPNSPAGTTTLVPTGATWKYLDNGTSPAGWNTPAFNDNTWASGPAPLGYGDPMSTTISFGPNSNNKYITSYFRNSFNVTNPAQYSGLLLDVRRDDGAVVYLNGTEVWRTNMPAGTILSSTLASTTVDGANESAFFSTTLSAAQLISGTNVLAVEVHQILATSSDIGFDLKLTGIPTPDTGNWIAYNDFNGVVGDANAANVTRYPYTSTLAALKDFTTGNELSALLTGSTIGGYDPIAGNGGPANAGTDAASTFGPTGTVIVDLNRTIELDATNWANVATFNNLNPSKVYTIALTANRAEPSYINARYTRVTIEGADGFSNASTAGVIVNSPSSVSFSTGYNSVNGYVARWRNVRPGTDGSFSIRSEWDSAQGSGISNTKGYAMSAVMLQAGDPTTHTLTVNVVGTGTVTKNPNQPFYALGDVVQLTATPGPGQVFGGWSGGLTGRINPVSVTITSNTIVTATFTTATCVANVDSFNTYTVGQRIGQQAGWFDGGAGPVIGANNGVAATQGLTPANNIFTWVAQPFNWNAPTFQKAGLQMDFQTSPTGQFDDDRVGWMITNTSSLSDFIFGVQLDPDDGGTNLNIEGYWDGATTDLRPSIVSVPTVLTNTWYRLNADFTKLTATSARIDVNLTRLDAGGNPVSVVATGAIPDTSALGANAPATKYFTATTMWAAYKNFSATVGTADNAYLQTCAFAPANIAVQVVPNTLIANSGATAVVTATVTDAFGNLLNGVNLNGSTTPSSLGGVTFGGATNASGQAFGTWTAGATIGTGTLNATNGSVTGTTSISLTAGAPSTIEVVVSPNTLIANSGASGTVTATVKDVLNNPISGVTLGGNTQPATLGAVTGLGSTNAAGQAIGTWTAGSVAGTGLLRVGNGSLTGTANITLTIGAPFTITLQANPTALLANGSSTSIVTATVVDQFNNFVVDGTPVNFSAVLGSVTTPHNTTNGRTVATFTAGTLAGTATVTGTTNGRSGAVNIALTSAGSDLSSSTKTANVPVVSSTGRLTYTIVLTNSGNSVAANVTLTDAIPLNTMYVAGSATGGATYNAGQNRIEWSGSVPALGSVTLTYAVDVNLPGFGVITNRAYVSISSVLDRILTVTTQVTPSGNPLRTLYLPLILR